MTIRAIANKEIKSLLIEQKPRNMTLDAGENTLKKTSANQKAKRKDFSSEIKEKYEYIIGKKDKFNMKSAEKIQSENEALHTEIQAQKEFLLSQGIDEKEYNLFNDQGNGLIRKADETILSESHESKSTSNRILGVDGFYNYGGGKLPKIK